MLSIDPKTFAEAYRIASRVTSLAIGTVVPPILGFLVDRRLATTPAGVLIGSLFGFLSLFLQLRLLVRELSSGKSIKTKSSGKYDGRP